MIAEVTDEPRGWSRRRLWTIVTLIFAAQIGLIFWFGNPPPAAANRAMPTAPLVHVTGNDAGTLISSLEDPTLFALPHRESFSGPAWLTNRPVEFQPARWTERPRLLELDSAQLGSGFTTFVATNQFAKFITAMLPVPDLILPELPPVSSAIQPSSLQVGGDLANRQLLSTFDLPPQPAADLLANTVVQVLVNGRGEVISAVVLPPGSGSKSADDLALQEAKTARFAPLKTSGSQPAKAPEELTLGTLIFQWQTVAPTNAAVAVP